MTRPPTMIGWDAYDPSLLRTGDIVHVRGGGWGDRLIRVGERSFGERPAWASHTEQVWRAGQDFAVDISVNCGRPRPIEFKAWRGQAQVLVTRIPGGLTPDQENQFFLHASQALKDGRGYGWIKIAANAADFALGGRYVFRRMCFLEKYPICSWDVSKRFWDVLKIHFNGRTWKWAQPDDVLDHCVKEAWPIIFTDSAETFTAFKGVYELAAIRREGRAEAIA